MLKYFKKFLKKDLSKEYKKKTSELLTGVFNSIYSLKGLDFDSITENDLKNAKFIHWPSTIKRNKPIYKLFKEERTTNLVLAIDELLLVNKYYLQLFLDLKKELNKIENQSLIKYIYLLRLGKKIAFTNFKLNNLNRIEELSEKSFGKNINLIKLFKLKNSLILLFTDFLDVDIETLKKLYLKSKSNELINLIFLPPFDFYYLVDPFEIAKVREKIMKKTKNLGIKSFYL